MFRFIICTSILSMIYVSCGNDRGGFKEFVVQGTEDIIITSSPLFHSDQEFGLFQNKERLIEEVVSLLPTEYVLLDFNSVNLNDDDVDEYIIAYIIGDEKTVRVLVVSYDFTIEKYEVVWNAESFIVNNQGISLLVRDVSGDFRKELILMGSDEDKNRTLDVFKMKRNTIPSYESVFTKTASSIEIIDNDSLLYKKILQTPYPQFILNTLDSNNDDIQEYYQWSNSNNKFIRIVVDRITRDDISKKRLSQLENADPEEVLQFLQGAWVRQEENLSSSQGDLWYIIIIADTKQVVFYSDKEAYIYTWKSFFRNVSSRGISIQVYATSNILPSINESILLDFLADDTFNLLVNETFSSDISGTYKKIENDSFFLEQLVKNNSALKRTRYTQEIIALLSGVFEDQVANSTYIFNYPELLVIDNGQERNAFYNVFDFDNDKTAIEIKYSFGDPSLFFLIRNSLKESGSMSLYPISIYADSFYPRSDTPIITLTPPASSQAEDQESVHTEIGENAVNSE